MRAHLALTAATALFLTAPVRAGDQTAYQRIAAGDYARAERVLLAERRDAPNRPEILLNLAAVYRQTGRAADARALYADVLRQPAKELDMLSGRTVSSHDVATTALASLPAETAIAAR